MRGASSDESDSDDEKKIVKSAKDKRLDEMEATIKVMDNAIKINDWVAITTEFDKLVRLVQRHQTLTVAMPPAAANPPIFIKSLIDMDTQIQTTGAREKEAKKKMNASNSKGFNGMKQKVKKVHRDFEAAIEAYRADPAAFEQAYLSAVNLQSNIAAEQEAALRSRQARKAAVEAGEEVPDEDFMTVGKGGRALNLTSDGVFKTLKTINESRGKKNTDRAETIRILAKLLEVSATPYQKIRVLLAIISARLDYSQNLLSMPHDSWCSAQKELDELLSMLLSSKDYQVVEEVEEYDQEIERVPGQGSEADNKRVKVRGSLISLLENVDNEFTKTLQNTDQHGTEYVERLREEKPLYKTIVKAQQLFEREALEDQTARAIMRRLEHVYCKPDIIVDVLEKAASSNPLSARDLVYSLSTSLYRSAPALIRTRAMLTHIFHHALQGRYYEARDMLLMSHLQDSIAQADITTQILYNRVVAQLGLAAFKAGHIAECQSTLLETFASQRPRELLAQGVQRFSQNTPEQDLIEKRRLLPFHLHINLELLETAFLVSCMLVEIPLLASRAANDGRKQVSKPFRRLLDQAERQAFMGPPENTRDHVMQASKALQAGDWRKAQDLISSIKIWALLDESDAIKTRLARQIQESGLRTYLFTYAPYYDSISLGDLAETFDLPVRSVTAIASKMIWNDELAASLDQIDQVIAFDRIESSAVQQLAQELANRAEALVELNEKTLDIKLGSGPGGDRADGERREGGGRGRSDRRGRGGFRGGRGRGGFNSGLGSATKVGA